MAARQERRSYWTWGYESDEPSGAVREEQARIVSARFGREVTPPPVVPVEEAELRPSRIEIPARMSWVTGDHVERATHTYGGHALELLAGLRGTFVNPPDAVAHPRNEDELEATLQWCDQKGFSAVPYGGGTSVVWGVNAPHGSEAAVTIDLDHLSSVIELDEISRAVRVEAGILGPDLEAHLKPFGLTLRHFPQSFRWSTVGGWIATRAGGHYATNHTHIDDFVEATRMLTPGGWTESGSVGDRIGRHTGCDQLRVVAPTEAACLSRYRRDRIPELGSRDDGGSPHRAVEVVAGQPADPGSGRSSEQRGPGWTAVDIDRRLRIGRTITT